MNYNINDILPYVENYEFDEYFTSREEDFLISSIDCDELSFDWEDGASKLVIIPEDKDNLDGLNYLANKSLGFVNEKAFLGTLDAHTETGKVPNVILEVEKLTAFEMGYLFYFFMKTCAMSAYMLDVNPFNQPGVEVYKKNMFHLLGKKGY